MKAQGMPLIVEEGATSAPQAEPTGWLMELGPHPPEEERGPLTPDPAWQNSPAPAGETARQGALGWGGDQCSTSKEAEAMASDEEAELQRAIILSLEPALQGGESPTRGPDSGSN